MWSLWMSRNDRKHGKAVIPVREAVAWIRDTTFDLWQMLHNKEKKCKVNQTWRPPEVGCEKKRKAIFSYPAELAASQLPLLLLSYPSSPSPPNPNLSTQSLPVSASTPFPAGEPVSYSEL
ncbi:hypothetical protein PR202_gb15858 [Eleusine coracana subsp. coracana]|uniref:Uncharacterized protein n=1 Tax=Eleusine coracana subsp. coracana TaxID=191504 RepID=A0AAV5EYZ2_ELECO|nr:hypothetical protein PR202_gb15858 [Eleusine coracana subsp. coracana]